jgi:hypothetical protein
MDKLTRERLDILMHDSREKYYSCTNQSSMAMLWYAGYIAGHRAGSRITKAKRELLRAVHANFISTKHQPPKGLSRREWLEKAATELWINPETKRVRK